MIAAGILPAAMEIMDHHTTTLVEDWLHLGLPLDAGAVLLIEVDGPAISLDGPGRAHQQRGARARRALLPASRKDDAERAAIWKGRKSAFGAYGRTASGFYIMDGVVPRTRLAEALATVLRLCAERGLEAGNVFHAGDGNLHPARPVRRRRSGRADSARSMPRTRSCGCASAWAARSRASTASGSRSAR